VSRKRFVVECIWNGYSGQARVVVHRTVETTFREAYEALRWHQFTDGTGMSIDVRDAKPRERVDQIRGYNTLLRDLVHKQYVAMHPDRFPSAKAGNP
jgi:hypothetical protein